MTKKELRQFIFEKFDGLCAYTGTPLKEDWQIDHKVPRIFYEISGKDGVDDVENLIPCQRIVNHYKKGLPLEEFRTWYPGGLHERLKRLPKNPLSKKSISKKEYLLEVASLFGTTEDIPFNGEFYFEKLNQNNMKTQDENFLNTQDKINNTSPDIRSNYSDGYHTFNELYEFRKIYNAALFNEWAKQKTETGKMLLRNPSIIETISKYDVHKSWRHNDGELCFGGGWFIVVAVLPSGQISNHYKAEDWDLFKIPEVEKAKYKFDGHTSQDVIERLIKLF